MVESKQIDLHEAFAPILQENDYLNFVYSGGRDSTKSWGVAGALVALSHTNNDLLICCAKGTMVSINDSVKKLIEDMIEFYGLQDYYYITEREIRHNVTNSIFIFKGLQHPDRLKSLEGVDWVWVEEANVDTEEYTFETFLPTIRKPGSKVIMTFNPKLKEDYVYDRYVMNTENYDYIRHLTYKDNPFLSDRSKTEIERMKLKNYPRYVHIYEGELSDDVDDALFRFDDIHILPEDEQAKMELVGWQDTFEKIVISLDPSGTNNDKSDACGIVVLGKYMKQDRYAVMADYTKVCRPSEWSKIAIQLYRSYGAHKMVYEGNFGKLMIEDLIRLQDRYIRFQQVNAKNSKIIRAEPVQSLYELHKVDHFGGLGPLELEMSTFTGDKNQKSPNRLDAMVWGIRYLCGKGGLKMGTGTVSLY